MNNTNYISDIPRPNPLLPFLYIRSTMSAAVLTCRRRPRSSSSSPAGSGGVSGLRALLAGRGRGGHHLRLAEAESNYSAAAAAASEENDRFWSEEPLVLHADACLDHLGRKVLPTVVEEGGGGRCGPKPKGWAEVSPDLTLASTVPPDDSFGRSGGSEAGGWTDFFPSPAIFAAAASGRAEQRRQQRATDRPQGLEVNRRLFDVDWSSLPSPISPGAKCASLNRSSPVSTPTNEGSRVVDLDENLGETLRRLIFDANGSNLRSSRSPGPKWASLNGSSPVSTLSNEGSRVIDLDANLGETLRRLISDGIGSGQSSRNNRSGERAKASPSSSRQKRRRKRDLIDTVSLIARKCQDMEGRLAERDAQVKELQNSLRKSGGADEGQEGGLATEVRAAAAVPVPVEERNIELHLERSLAANAKLEQELEAMRETAKVNSAALQQARTGLDAELDLQRKRHEAAIEELRRQNDRATRDVKDKAEDLNGQVQFLQGKSENLQQELDRVRECLHEESAKRAQENLNHAHEILEMSKKQEKRVADYKEESADLAEQNMLKGLRIEELDLSLELVRADQEFAMVKLERITKVHQEEVRALEREIDEKFLEGMMMTRDMEFQSLSHAIEELFEEGDDDMSSLVTDSESDSIE